MTSLVAPNGSTGWTVVFSDAAIKFCVTIKVLFNLPLRQTTGMVDSPGFKVLGDDGEWQACKYGVQGRRQWRKVHLAVDTATSDIRAAAFTPDNPILPDLLDQVPVGTVTADSAHGTRRCHTAIIGRKTTAIRKTGHPCKEDAPAAIARHGTLRTTLHYGRAFRKCWTGYPVRSRIEAKMRCLKAFGTRIAARDPDRQTADPRRLQQPLQPTRDRGERPRDLMPKGKGAIMPQA